MKKYILSLLIIFIFLWYSFYERKAASEHILPPNPKQPDTDSHSASVTQTPTFAPGVGTSTPEKVKPTLVKSIYKDGIYLGPAVDAYYGNIQVQTTIQNGRITDIQFLQYPSDRETSIEINTQALPALKQEAIQRQNAYVDIISGATDSSQAFIESLKQTLDQAQHS